LLASSTKGYNEAIAATYKLLCNLLASKPQTQWDCIIQEKHEHDLWAGADGKKHDEKFPRSYPTFLDCLELHKLTIFSADTAKRQRYYIQQGIQKPQQATIHQFISHVEVLNGYLRHLPMLKNSPKADATTKKGNVPFEEADLASIIHSCGRISTT
jgi:hypothetical protein